MKGFLTLATGKDLYYILAHNLLLSYRYHTKKSTPFAILCDRENEWTADFDQVILIDNPSYSYMDKIRIMDLSPYEETIFLESDCLIYRDLDELWSIFKDSPDLGLLGRTYPKDSKKGWWKDENLGALREKVDYKVICQGGLYYIRNKGKDLPAIQKTIEFIKEQYFSYHFSIFDTVLEDETILCLAAAVHHIRPVCNWLDVFVYYPEAVFSKVDIRKGALKAFWSEGDGGEYSHSFFIHFVTSNTLSPTSNGLYYREVYRLKKKPNWKLDLRNALTVRGRKLVNHSRFFHAVANLFPKELRNKYNQVKKNP